MTLSLYLQCIAIFFCGQLVHLFGIKIPALKERCRVANKPFSAREWWLSDWNLVIVSAVLGVAVIIGLDEIIHWKPDVIKFVKWFFFLLGGFGSTIVLGKWSTFEKKLNDIVDIKTDIADGKTSK